MVSWVRRAGWTAFMQATVSWRFLQFFMVQVPCCFSFGGSASLAYRTVLIMFSLPACSHPWQGAIFCALHPLLQTAFAGCACVCVHRLLGVLLHVRMCGVNSEARPCMYIVRLASFGLTCFAPVVKKLSRKYSEIRGQSIVVIFGMERNAQRCHFWGCRIFRASEFVFTIWASTTGGVAFVRSSYRIRLKIGRVFGHAHQHNRLFYLNKKQVKINLRCRFNANGRV